MCKSITICDRIKEYRASANITQKELGDILGVTAQAVSKWESGKSYPDITILPKVALILKCSVADFFAGSDDCET